MVEPVQPDYSVWSTSGVFVGRRREMAGLNRALDEVLSGKGKLVMLAGEPGIGKTRTAQELAAEAQLRETWVLWGRCYDDEGAPPYWPWVQLLRAYLRRADREYLVSQLDQGAVDIAGIIPEVRDILPNLGPPPSLEPEQARFQLFYSIA
ncbi:MAG: AAA family ATPase, partial [Dehalococcoidia bacterium]